MVQNVCSTPIPDLYYDRIDLLDLVKLIQSVLLNNILPTIILIKLFIILCW